MGDNLLGMTRRYEGDVAIPATCLQNWDMLPLLKLMQCDIFPDKVNKAVDKVAKYTRNDLAHERFDCDWCRDWWCMEELLKALGCSKAGNDLRKFCGPLNKSYCDNGGCKYRMHEYATCVFGVCFV